MRAVWAYALYCPAGRLSDWFRSPDACPGPRRWYHYAARELEVQRQYIGDMSTSEEREIFGLATRELGPDACRQSPQAKRRDAILAHRLDEMLADVPSTGPAQ